MVRFIRYWIEQGMESPEAREEKARLHMEKLSADAKALVKQWEQSSKPPGYWNSRASRNPTEFRLSQVAAESLSPYERVLADMDASKRAAKDK